MDSSTAQRWDDRYSGAEYAFGTAPNDFLTAVVDRLPQGRARCLGEGEGRHAVFQAERGYKVTAVDISSVGLQKAERLAAERGVQIRTRVRDLREYVIEPQTWDVVVLTFCTFRPSCDVRYIAQPFAG